MFNTAYKVNVDGTASLGSFLNIPSDFTAYTVGSEPQELLSIQALETAANLAVQEEADAKQAKNSALDSITVITANGNEFDGDDTARADMCSAVFASDTLGLIEHNWKLADNTWALITLVELKEALALAIQAKGAILAA